MKRSNSHGIVTALLSVFLSFIIAGPASGQPPKMKMTTEIPESILTADTVQTSIGTFEYFDGFPTGATAQKCYDYLDTARGVEVFLNCLPVASLVAMREGLASVGVTGNTVGIYENLMDSKSLFLTPNTESVYAPSGSICPKAPWLSKARRIHWESAMISGFDT